MEERELCVYTDAIRDAIQAIPEDMILKSEKELRDIVKPTYQHYQFKNYFWDEMARATTSGSKMIASRIYSNMTSRQYFYSRILKDTPLMAWMVTPIVEYETKARAALDKISERYEELIGMEITTTKRIKDAEGEYHLVTETDPKKALVLLQTIKNLEERVKGSSIQRNVSVSATAPDTGRGESASIDINSVDEKLRELEKKINPYGTRRRDELHDEKRDGAGQPEDDISKNTEGVIIAESKRIGEVDK